MSGWGLRYDNDEQRVGHIFFMEKFEQWLIAGCPGGKFSLYMACRYGKTDMLRNAIVLAKKHDVAPSGLAIHPYPVLSKQLCDEFRMRKWHQRWLPSGPVGWEKKFICLPSFKLKTMTNGEWMGSIHIQAIMSPVQFEAAKKWVEWCKHKSGKPPLIIIDESHQYSGNDWGAIAKALHSMGCPILVMTATPFRNDDDELFGFKKELIDNSTDVKVVHYTTQHQDPDKLNLHTRVQEERYFTIKADCEVPFPQAWQEGAIARLSKDEVDFNLKGWGKYDGKEPLLSELSKADAAKVLPQLVRDPQYVQAFVERIVNQIDRYRKTREDATAIVYGMDDRDGESNAHQNLIASAFKSLRPKWVCKIATLKTDEEEGKKGAAADAIGAFCDPKKKNCDVLILKQMASVGIDSDRICVVGLLHTTRSPNAIIQQQNRCCNIADGKTHGVVVQPHDIASAEIFKRFVEDEGGKYTDLTVVSDDSEVIDKQDKEDGGYLASSAASMSLTDSDLNIANHYDVLLAYRLLEQFPILILSYTIPEIAKKAKELGMQSPFEDTKDELDFREETGVLKKYRAELNQYVTTIARLLYSKEYGRKWDRDTASVKGNLAVFGRLKWEATVLIKKRAGVFESWDEKNKNRSDNTNDHQRWLSAAASICEEMSCASQNC